MDSTSKIHFQDPNFTIHIPEKWLFRWVERPQAWIPPFIIYLNSILGQRFISVHVIRQISKTIFLLGSHKTYCSENQIAGCHGLNSKNMLNTRTNSGAGSVSLLFPFGQFLVAAAFALKMSSIALLFKAFYRILRSVSGICIYISATVCIIQKFFKNIAVMYRSIRDRIAANELVFHINADMIFIAIVPFTALYGPPGIGILLALFSTFPILGNVALFDLLIFITAVPLFGSRNNTGIYNLPFLSGITVVLEEFVKFCKQFFDQIRLGKLISEKPNGLGIRDSVSQVQIKEAHKRQAIKNLKFYGIIRKIIKGLNDKNFKHQNNIIVFRARAAFCFLLPDLFKGRPKLFPVDKPIKLKKRIFLFVQFAKSIMNVKKPCLQNFVPFFGVNSSNQCLATG